MGVSKFEESKRFGIEYEFCKRCVRGRRKDSTAQAFLQNILKDCSEGETGGQLRDLMMGQRKDSASLQKKGKKKKLLFGGNAWRTGSNYMWPF